MKRDIKRLVRAHLLANPDGATVTEIAAATDSCFATITRALDAMSDVYIDRWIQNPRAKSHPVFVAVPIPADCPPPERKARRA